MAKQSLPAINYDRRNEEFIRGIRFIDFLGKRLYFHEADLETLKKWQNRK